MNQVLADEFNNLSPAGNNFDPKTKKRENKFFGRRVILCRGWWCTRTTTKPRRKQKQNSRNSAKSTRKKSLIYQAFFFSLLYFYFLSLLHCKKTPLKRSENHRMGILRFFPFLSHFFFVNYTNKFLFFL